MLKLRLPVGWATAIVTVVALAPLAIVLVELLLVGECGMHDGDI